MGVPVSSSSSFLPPSRPALPLFPRRTRSIIPPLANLVAPPIHRRASSSVIAIEGRADCASSGGDDCKKKKKSSRFFFFFFSRAAEFFVFILCTCLFQQPGVVGVFYFFFAGEGVDEGGGREGTK